MTEMTTIKVSRALRDRIRRVATSEQVTLSAVIEHALDEADERAFWSALTAEHAALSGKQRTDYVDGRATSDDLADSADDAITARDGW